MLNYFERSEDYRIVRINDRSVITSTKEPPGHLNPVDFGNIPQAVFEPKSQASFNWERWDVLDGRPVAVLSFAIDLAHSPFTSPRKSGPGRVKMGVQKGLIYADEGTYGVVRIAMDSLDLHDAESKDHTQVHDYRYQKIGGREFLLPVRLTELLHHADGTVTKNESEFGGYRILPNAGSAGDGDVTAQALAKMDGLWESDGYGTFFEIQGGLMSAFAVTSATCLPWYRFRYSAGQLNSRSIVLDKSSVTARLHVTGGVSDVILRRVEERPKSCMEKPANTPLSNYSIFWQTFAENYPFFDLHHVDWAEADRKYRPRVTPETSSKTLFGIFQKMIEPLHDGHTYIAAKDLEASFGGSRSDHDELSDEDYSKYAEITQSKYVQGELRSFCKGKVWFGMLAGSVGYLLIPSFEEFGGPVFQAEAQFLEEALDQIFRDSTELKGLVIDIRHNDGGADALGLIIASRFTIRKYLAYSKETRNSPGRPLHFTAPQPICVMPSERPSFQGEAVLLTGRDCASACETFAMATMGRQPKVVRVGESTVGVFSDILARPLPNGWSFGLPNEVYRTVDGRSFDGAGVPPDIAVPVFTPADLRQARDSAIERALTILNVSSPH